MVSIEVGSSLSISSTSRLDSHYFLRKLYTIINTEHESRDPSCSLRSPSTFFFSFAGTNAQMSTSATSDAAAQAAAEAAAAASAAFVVELWTLYATGVAVTVLRTYARLKAVGIKNFRADDYLIWAAIVRPT